VPSFAVWILVVLAAILVAAAVPALIQLRQTLQTAQRTLETTGRRLDETLTQLAATLERVNRASTELEQGVSRISGLLETLGSAGDTLMNIRSSLTRVAAVGTVLAEFVASPLRSLFRRRRGHRRGHDGEPRSKESRLQPEEIIR
jgi:predicted PurR-regulated permease PerM